MKKLAIFFLCTLFLMGCNLGRVSEPTRVILVTNTSTPTVTASLTPQAIPTLAPPSPTPIPDSDCTDQETFEPGVGLHFNGSSLVRMGNGQLYGIDWSQDGKLIAVGTETGIYLLDATTLEQLRYIETLHEVEVVRFSPNGKLIATDDYSKVAVWDVESGMPVAHLGEKVAFHSVRWGFPFSAEVGNLSFHPDGRLIALHSMNYSGSDSNPSIEIWDIQTQELVREWKANDKSFFLPDALFSPDGKWIVSNWDDGITAWDMETGEEVRKFLYQGRKINFGPTGHKLAIADAERVRVVDLVTGTSTSINAGNTYEPVTGLISTDEKKLITHYTENKEPYKTPVSIWDITTGKKLHDLDVTDFVIGFSRNPIKNELATIGYNRQTYTEYVRVWDIDSGKLLHQLTFSRHIARKLALSPDGAQLIVELNDHFHLYNAKTGGYLCMLEGEVKKPYHLSFSKDGENMAYVNLGGDATVWNLITGEIVQTFKSGAAIEVDPQLTQFLSLEKKIGQAMVWAWKSKNDDTDAKVINTCDSSTSIPTDCPGAFSPDGTLIIKSDWQSLSIQETLSQKVLSTLDDSRGMTNFTFSPDGRYILGLSYMDWTVSVWDAKTYKKVATINSGMEGEGPILGNQEFSFTTDGTQLATYLPYYHKGAVRIWNTKTWEMEKTLDSKGGIGGIAISGDGKLIVGLSGYVIYFWQTEQ